MEPRTDIQTLESVLNRVAVDNNLTTIAVGRMQVGDRVVYHATVHYDGLARDGYNCSRINSSRSIGDALFGAIHAASANRTPVVSDEFELPALVVEAA